MTHASGLRSAVFRAQRLNWIDAPRPPRGQRAGDHRHDDQRDGRAIVEDWIERTMTLEAVPLQGVGDHAAWQ